MAAVPQQDEQHKGRGFEGWLMKLGTGIMIFSSWKRRYFVIFDNSIWYYEDENQTRSIGRSDMGNYLGIIPLVGAEFLEPDTTLELPKSVDPKLVMYLSTSKRVFVLVCSDEREKGLWIDAISARILDTVPCPAQDGGLQSIGIHPRKDTRTDMKANMERERARSLEEKVYTLPERLVDYFFLYRRKSNDGKESKGVDDMSFLASDMQLACRCPAQDRAGLQVEDGWVMFALPSSGDTIQTLPLPMDTEKREQKLLELNERVRVHYAVLCSGTNARTINLYAVFLTFYEPTPDGTRAQPAVMAFLSHYPQFELLAHCLRHLHADAFFDSAPNQAPLSVERVVAYLVHHVPFPVVGQQAVQFKLGHAMVKASIPALHPPSASCFRLSKLTDVLSVDVLLEVFECILGEGRVLFHSASLQRLVVISQCFLQLIYPFEWKGVYIPLVPRRAAAATQIVGQFLLGIETSFLFEPDSDQLQENIVLHDVLVVDLDDDKTTYYPFPAYFNTPRHQRRLPTKPLTTLRAALVAAVKRQVRYVDMQDAPHHKPVLLDTGLMTVPQFDQDVLTAILRFYRASFMGFRDFVFRVGGRPFFILDEFVKTHPGCVADETDLKFYREFPVSTLFRGFLDRDHELRTGPPRGSWLMCFDYINAQTERQRDEVLVDIRKLWGGEYDVFQCKWLNEDHQHEPADVDRAPRFQIDTEQLAKLEAAERTVLDQDLVPFVAFRVSPRVDVASLLCLSDFETGLYRFLLEVIQNDPDLTLVHLYKEMLTRLDKNPRVAVETLRMVLKQPNKVCVSLRSLVILSHMVLHCLRRLDPADHDSVAVCFKAAAAFYTVTGIKGHARVREHGEHRRRFMADVISTLHPFRDDVSFWSAETKRKLIRITQNLPADVNISDEDLKSVCFNACDDVKLAINRLAARMSILGVRYQALAQVLYNVLCNNNSDITKDYVDACSVFFSSDVDDAAFLPLGTQTNVEMLRLQAKKHVREDPNQFLSLSKVSVLHDGEEHPVQECDGHFYFLNSCWIAGFFSCSFEPNIPLFADIGPPLNTVVILGFYHLYVFKASVGVNPRGLLAVIRLCDRQFSTIVEQEERKGSPDGQEEHTVEATKKLQLLVKTGRSVDLLLTLDPAIECKDEFAQQLVAQQSEEQRNAENWRLWIELIRVTPTDSQCSGL